MIVARPWKLDDEHSLDAECYLQLLLGIFVHTAEVAGKPTAEEALEGLKAGAYWTLKSCRRVVAWMIARGQVQA